MKKIMMLFAVVCMAGCAFLPLARKPAVKVEIDWSAFMARQDLVFDKMPMSFDEGAFLGNGMMGTTIYQQGDNKIRWNMGRSDVTDHYKDNARVAIGALVLETVGKIQSATMRLDIWNAEVRGTVKTDKGELKYRTIIHTDKMAMILDLEVSGEEKTSKFVWEEGKGVNALYHIAGIPANPQSVTKTANSITVCTQARGTAGEFATAWQEVTTPALRRIYMSIADSFPGNTAGNEAVETVKQAVTADFDKLLGAHRDWWHAIYPRSFVSVPDPKLESFYWMQIYKLASASRPDRGPVDLLGPWYRETYWPRVWWNLNIETLYLPVYTANQLELGESFVRLLDDKRDNFFEQGRLLWNCADGASVSHTTDNQGKRGNGTCSPGNYLNPGDFTWALHNYYLHYRHSMDHTMITDQKKHSFYPLLRGSMNVYMQMLKKGEDGKLHLPVLHSPEYGDCADNNYNLGLLRWGLKTLMELNERYKLNDPLLGKWRETLDNLTPFPTNENGLSVGANTPFARPHRHWSHMLMVHPLHLLDMDDKANRELLTKSILHWLKTGDTQSGDGIFGWSRAAAASLCAAMGDGDKAIEHIHKHMADKRFVRGNTMYIEGCPVIECSVVLAKSLQDMLLQSYGSAISVFPAIPATWKDAVFHDLRAEGAFLVSAERKDGKTSWIRVKSLAGEPCRIKTDLPATMSIHINGRRIDSKSAGNGIYELPLAKGDEAVLTADTKVSPVVRPLPSLQPNPWGIKN